MTNVDRLIVDRENAISETLDGEVVIIHLHSGAYYSADVLGTELWGRFEQGASVAELGQELAERFDAEPGQIEQALDGFVATLRREGLIRSMDSTEFAMPPRSDDSASVVSDPEPVPGNGKPPFKPPTFEVYEDLRELLHADPIHDVMNAGWPHLKSDAE